MNNKIISGLASFALQYVGGRVLDYVRKRRDASAPAAIAIATAIQIGRQLVLSNAHTTPAQLITDLKGVFAIQLAQAGIYEERRAPFQPTINHAIGCLVTEWYERSGSKSVPPILAKIAKLV